MEKTQIFIIIEIKKLIRIEFSASLFYSAGKKSTKFSLLIL